VLSKRIIDFLSDLSVGRVRLLWIVMGALFAVSVLPLWLYHRQVIQLSDEKLEDTERVQQSEITRSLAGEILQIESNLQEQLQSQRQFLLLTGWIESVDDPEHSPQLTRMLQNFIESDPHILYVTAVGKQARGESAGSIRAELDPFVEAALKRAFQGSMQELNTVSEPFAMGENNNPALVVSVPLIHDGQFAGMLAVVVSLDQIVDLLKNASVRDRTYFVVDVHGHIVAHPETRDFVPGMDVSNTSPVVARFKELPMELRTTANIRFTENAKGQDHAREMIGTYSTIPQLRWAVVAQRGLAKARIDAGVQELTTQAVRFVFIVSLSAIILGYMFAVGITRPIRGLVESTHAISRAEFHERVDVSGAAEIGELAETFNDMAGEIEKHVESLRQAATENRELFLGSIRMLAAAIDEKDPYTRGHSGRVAKYSLAIGESLKMNADELDCLRISALLHDVGKIGVEDRILKKPGKLTDEEFDVMKQHTSKGANIMRPVAQLKDMLPGIEFHHERMDGQGYPSGLAGEQIPLLARIIAVADTFDAITTNRPYQTAMDLTYAIERIRSLAISRFDPQVVDAFEAAVHSGAIKLSATLIEV
jgi:HD-GYP domain-containing protein (c-di-GMP phosphodiesterase class II)